MKKNITRILSMLVVQMTLTALAGKPALPLNTEWEELLRSRAPEQAPASPVKPRKVLVFSLATGYQHWCIPHTEAVVRILGEKSGAFEVVASRDIEQFQAENLAHYDAVVMNNTCPHGKDWDTFRDVLINNVATYGANYKELPLADREALATALYQNLVDYVSGGGGLVLLHGGITSFNHSDEFSAIVGGSFHFHPPQQDVVLKPVDSSHPLLKPFAAKPFTHHDEPYLFNRAYQKMNFYPLLEMDVSELKPNERLNALPEIPRYVSWIKRHQQGRVFFCSPSHNAQSFEQPELLAFILGGIQYALGDLECPDAPIGSPAGL